MSASWRECSLQVIKFIPQVSRCLLSSHQVHSPINLFPARKTEYIRPDYPVSVPPYHHILPGPLFLTLYPTLIRLVACVTAVYSVSTRLPRICLAKVRCEFVSFIHPAHSFQVGFNLSFFTSQLEPALHACYRCMSSTAINFVPSELHRVPKPWRACEPDVEA
jgi:hypothetical protein